jgi:hypothetical protein
VKPGWSETIAESLFDNNLQVCMKASFRLFYLIVDLFVDLKPFRK